MQASMLSYQSRFQKTLKDRINTILPPVMDAVCAGRGGGLVLEPTMLHQVGSRCILLIPQPLQHQPLLARG